HVRGVECRRRAGRRDHPRRLRAAGPPTRGDRGRRRRPPREAVTAVTAMRQRLRPVPWLLVAPLLAACAGARPTPSRAPMSPAEFFTRAVATIQRQHVEPESATQLADRALREVES